MTNKPSKAEKLRALQDTFIKELPARLETIEAMWNKDDFSEHKGFHRQIHSLSGSAGTFGFPQLGECAHEIELLIANLNGSVANKVLTLEIEKKLSELHSIADKGVEKGMVNASSVIKQISLPVAEDQTRLPLIYVLEDDVILAKEIEQQLEQFGYQVEVFNNTTAFQVGIDKKIPDALLADIQLPEGTNAGPQAAADLRKRCSHDVPVIFASGQNSWQDRLNAVRAGGQSYLTKPINFTSLIEQLDVATGKEQESQFRILIVDDTVLLAEHYALVLQAAGMQTEVIHSPEKILDVLAGYRPDLILMDLYMPGCNGVEAAQVVRQHTDYTNIPIVYLSTEKGRDQQLEALLVGDDFLQKPISDPHLVAAVRIRARRFRELNALMSRDGLTGLLNHINLKLALEREVSQSLRRHSTLSFVMLDIDHFKSVNDTYGHPVGDQVIKSLARLLIQRLRKGDIAARYGGEEFALILPDTSVAEARKVIDDLRQQFSKIIYRNVKGDFNSTFSGGIASSPPHTDMEQLITAADNALYRAKHGGRNQIAIETQKSADIESSLNSSPDSIKK